MARIAWAFAVAALALFSCAGPRAGGSFRVVAAEPAYLLRSPDAIETPFPEVLSRYSETAESPGWLLHPNTELRIENAYYREGAPKHGIANFIGTETAVFEVHSRGLRLISAESGVEQPPADQPPVGELIGASRLRYRHYRYFFQIVFRKTADSRGAVLLGASTLAELDRLATQLASDPDSVCRPESSHCSVFPEACSVALQIQIFVNGARKTVAWGDTLAKVVSNPAELMVQRLHESKLTPVELDARDPQALRLPLLPGDHVTWK